MNDAILTKQGDAVEKVCFGWKNKQGVGDLVGEKREKRRGKETREWKEKYN